LDEKFHVTLACLLAIATFRSTHGGGGGGGGVMLHEYFSSDILRNSIVKLKVRRGEK
jgi:hypothetical protein